MTTNNILQNKSLFIDMYTLHNIEYTVKQLHLTKYKDS
jgi:hypothetical protein